MARSWSARARRDFKEREDYRRRNDEKDRYEKRGDSAREDDRRSDRRDNRDDERRDSRSEQELERDAREDRREERGWYEDEIDGDYENDLMQIRNAGPDEDVTDTLDRLRKRYDYYERELDRYDADYDDLVAEMKELRRDNARYMMREGAEIKDQQDDDIKLDNKILSDEDLWKTREG